MLLTRFVGRDVRRHPARVHGRTVRRLGAWGEEQCVVLQSSRLLVSLVGRSYQLSVSEPRLKLSFSQVALSIAGAGTMTGGKAERVLKREFGSKDLRMSEDCVTM